MENKCLKKYDAASITQGRAKYTAEYVSADALIVGLKRSQYARAHIVSIDKSRAEKVPGVVAIYTYEDVPKTRFTLAGQSYPEPSPRDRLILDQDVRYWNEPVAIVCGVTKEAVEQAIARLKVEYEVKTPILDPEKALVCGERVHEEETHFFSPDEIFGYEPDKNLVAHVVRKFGEETDKVYARSEVQVHEKFHVFPQAHAMMETYRSYTFLDPFGRLNVVSSTQVPFHIKRQLAQALEIADHKIRITKPRVGGGFGGKQTSVTEVYPAFVTMKTGRPAYLELTREETFTATNSRHQMSVEVFLGGTSDGTIETIEIRAISDQGAYGEHAFTTLGLVGDKTLPLYPHLKAAAFDGKVVYTNKMPGAAFRGYGAVQGMYAVESVVNIYAQKVGLDPIALRLKNTVEEGDHTLAYGMDIRSCKLKDCIRQGKEMIGWEEIYPYRLDSDGNIIAVGMASAMQGSGIANVDTSTVEVRLNEQGGYTLYMSPTDTGTGTDTILIDLCAKTLGCSSEDIVPIIADTDLTPFDPGSYASSGVYITGSAVIRAAEDLIEMIKREAAKLQNTYPSWIEVHNGDILIGHKKIMTVKQLAQQLATGPSGKNIVGIGHFDSRVSPPPYMAGFAKIHINIKTGKVRVIDYAAVVDCGTIMAENLARVQVEGGVTQSIGYTLYEGTDWDENGRMLQKSFMQYKLPTRQEIDRIQVAFCPSYEPTGPLGAKSIGELVCDTPAPAICHALYNATGHVFNKIPVARDEVVAALQEKFRDRPYHFL